MDKVDEMILQDTLQVSLAEHKSREEQDARENMAPVDEHLASEEIEKMLDVQELLSFDRLANNLHDVMVETLPAMVDKHIKEQVVKQVSEQV
ncbi:hypothetical protein Tco_0297193 [Tanacetum coccineum]